MIIVCSLPPPPKTGEGDATADNEKVTQRITGKESNPPGIPLNHHAPRWQTLRNESTGKGPERTAPKKPHGKTLSPRHRGRRWVATISVHHLVVTLTSEQPHRKTSKNLIHDTRVLILKGVWRHRRCFANKTDCLRIRKISTHHNEDRAERQEMLSRLNLPLN